MYSIYGNIYHQYTPVMLAYIPYMDPVGMIYVSLKQIPAETPRTSRHVWSAGPSPSWPVLMLAFSSPSLFRLWSLSWCPKSHSNNFGQGGDGWSVSTVGSARHRVCLGLSFCWILRIFVNDLQKIRSFFFKWQIWLASSLTAPEPLNSSNKKTHFVVKRRTQLEVVGPASPAIFTSQSSKKANCALGQWQVNYEYQNISKSEAKGDGRNLSL